MITSGPNDRGSISIFPRSAIKSGLSPIPKPEKALYVNRLMTARIEGFDRQESDALLEELFAVGEDLAIIYEHVWRPGDLVMWDNLQQHARTDFPHEERRLLRRTTPIGTEAPR